MASRALIAEERIGLAVALALHAALVAAILWRPPSAPVVPPPERVTVTLTDEVAPTSTSPEPMAEPPASAAAPEPGDLPKPQQVLSPPPSPSPLPRATASPQPRPQPRPALSASARPVNRSGASRIGSDFLPAEPNTPPSGTARNPPAASIGPAVQSALVGAISRQLRPQWQGKVPQGVDAEKLVTVLAWGLNPDGSLAGTPRVVRQEGITDANRAQAARHAEQAIRAVQLAAPFDLPAEYYEGWKRISSFRFDKRLAQ